MREQRPQSHISRKKGLLQHCIAPLLVLFALLIWEILCTHYRVPAYLLPAPSGIFSTLHTEWELLLRHGLITGLEIVSGIGLALACALPLSILMFARPALDRSLRVFLVASQAIPVFALAPLLVVWLGYGMASKVFMAAIIIFFPITVSLLQGLKSCDMDYQRLFQLMGAGFFTKLRLLYWPWALPHFFAGLKVGVTVATIGAVIGEWVGAQGGLGYLMIQSNARLKTDLVFAAILLLSLMGLGLWGLVNWCEKKMIHWNIQ